MADFEDAIKRFIEAQSRQQERRHIVSGRFDNPFGFKSDSSESDDGRDHSGSRYSRADSVSSISKSVDFQWDQTEAESQLELLALNMLVSWFDHPIGHDSYANIIISSSAVMGIQDEREGGWHSPLNYTPIYSGVIKVVRCLVVLQSWQELEAKVEEGISEAMNAMAIIPGSFSDRQHRKVEQDVREKTQSIFSIVRAKVQRFMTRTSQNPDAEPTPFDFMFEARAMGMKIRYDTTAPGTIDWNGNIVVFREIRFSMVQLSIMLRELIQEARELIAELTMAPAGDVDQLPRIPWDRIQDTHSNTRVGYSFLTDPGNTWLQAGRQWIIKQIPKSKKQLHR
jgi:hypothetical protein